MPTAQHSDTEGQVTPKSSLDCTLGLGEATIAQELPFHCSMSVWVLLGLPDSPTVQHCDVDGQVTPPRVLFSVALVLGEVTIAHELPFHCSTSV